MSKNIRTVQQLQETLDAERIWRVRELSILRKKLLSSIDGKSALSEQELALLRPCVTMIYGHWEGFVKAACGCYLAFVALQRLKNKEMQPNFLALAARKFASDNGAFGVDADRIMISFIRDASDGRGYIPYKSGVDTKSNLWFNVFQEIYDSLGLPWHQYVLKKNLIDIKLVSKRNAIAHGKSIDVSHADVVELFESIIQLMSDIKDQLLDFAINSKYKITT